MVKNEMRGRTSLFERLKFGLEQAAAYSRGELTLMTTVLPKPATRFTPTRIIRVRRKLEMSRFLFATVLNIPIGLLKKWEQGDSTPGRAERPLLQIIEARPGIVRELFGDLHDRRLKTCTRFV